MALDYRIQTADPAGAYQLGQQRYHQLQAAREQTSQAPLRKRMAELGVKRKEQAVQGTELDFQNQSVKKYIGDAYQLSQIQDPQERLATAQRLAQSYLSNNDPYDDEAGNNLMQIIQAGPEALDQTIGAVVQRGAAEGVIQLPREKQTPSAPSSIQVINEARRLREIGTPQAIREAEILEGTLQRGSNITPAEIAARKEAEQLGTARGEAGAASIEGSTAFFDAEDRKRKIAAEQQAGEESRADEINDAFVKIGEAKRNINQLRELTKDIDESTTGFAQQALGWIPWTEAGAVRKNLESLRAKVGFETLQQMRDRSKTGGALGQVSERELELLYSSIAAIDAQMDDKEVKTNLLEIISRWERSKALIEAEYDEDSPYRGMSVKQIDEEINKRFPIGAESEAVDYGSMSDDDLLKF